MIRAFFHSKKRAVSSLFVLLVFSAAFANAETDYERWLKSTQQAYQNYLDENDRAFSQFLKQKWEPVVLDRSPTPDSEPKPDSTPILEPVDDVPEQVSPSDQKTETPPDQTPIIEMVEQPEPEDKKPSAQELPTASKPQSTPKPIAQTGKQLTVNFYGHSFRIPYDAKLKRAFTAKPDSQSIARYWETLAKNDVSKTLEFIQAQANQSGMNDWTKTLLIRAFAEQLQPNSNSRALTSWFLLVKAGYDARVAYSNQIYLLMPANTQLYNTTYFTLSGKNYYLLDANQTLPKGKKVYTYEGQHQLGRNLLSFDKPNDFVPGGKTQQRQFEFGYDDQQKRINLDVPLAYRDYFNSYPQLELTHYFQAGLPTAVAQSLVSQLESVVVGQSELEAANRLLRFVQTAFQYQTDEQQFHRENYLFPLETLMYPYSDCEDRAALFSWLVERMLGLETRILGYPGHISVAVAFSTATSGDQWPEGSRSFVIADPTYINARVGMTMPDYRNQTPSMTRF